MEEHAKTRIHKSLIFVETSRFQVQKDSLKDYRKEKLTPTEIKNNKMYLKDSKRLRVYTLPFIVKVLTFAP